MGGKKPKTDQLTGVKQMNLSFQVKFSDGTTFTGNSLTTPKWNDMPDKPIISVTYLFQEKRIMLEKFKEYNHLVEKTCVMGQSETVSQIVLIGRKETESHLVVIDFLRKKIYKEVVELGAEFGDMIVTGWKKGV